MLLDTEAEIFSRVIDPSNPSMTSDVARAVLELGFTDVDRLRMQELAVKSNEGTLSPDERRELEGFVFVGDVLSMLKSKARLSIKQHNSAA